MINMQDEIAKQANIIAQNFINQQMLSEQLLSSGKVYSRFNSDDIIQNQKELVTSPLWSDDSFELSMFYTNSNATSFNTQYYYSIHQEATTVSSSEKQFDVSYGHRFGSGSYSGDNNLNNKPSKAIYSQYKQLLLDSGDDVFAMGDSVNTDHIYVINIARTRFKERIDPGNWEISLSELDGGSYANNVYTGSNVQVSSSNKIITLIDDSDDFDNSTELINGMNRVYNIKSGSLTNGVYDENTYYGLFYPDRGIIVLDANKLNSNLSFNTVTSSNANGDNSWKLFTSISGSTVIDSEKTFQGRSSEVISSTYYYARIKNKDYNYSNNPTYLTGSFGDLKYSSFHKDPKTYITTVGLYNDSYELLAVAKISKPKLKSFNTEYVLKCKLDW
jgi:hypothetical protein